METPPKDEQTDEAPQPVEVQGNVIRVDFEYLSKLGHIAGCPFYDKGPDGDLAA